MLGHIFTHLLVVVSAKYPLVQGNWHSKVSGSAKVCAGHVVTHSFKRSLPNKGGEFWGQIAIQIL